MAIINNETVLHDADGKPILSYKRGKKIESGEIHPYGSPFEIIIARSDGTAVINDIFFYINKGDILIFSENEKITVDKTNSNILINSVSLFPSFTSNISKLVPFLEKVNFFKTHSNKFMNIIKHYENSAEKISEYLFNIDYAVSEKNKITYLSVLQQLTLIITEISEHTEYPCSETSESTVNTKHKSVIAVTDYINTHINEDFSLDKLAKISRLNPNYLSNVFKEETGILLWDYINEKRINNAKKILIDNPNDSVLSVALKCGFNSCPNFNRVFKKYTGLTPGKYRQSLK